MVRRVVLRARLGVLLKGIYRGSIKGIGFRAYLEVHEQLLAVYSCIYAIACFSDSSPVLNHKALIISLTDPLKEPFRLAPWYLSASCIAR